jgi:creatinine deaminase
MTDREMLEIALEEARSGLGEGGIPIGAALFTADGKLLGRGRNRRVQQQDPHFTARPTRFDAVAGGAPTGTP